MVPLPCTGSNVRSMDMQFTQVAYGGCWKCPQDWQCCSASTPCLAASQKGFVHSFGTGMGLVTLLQSLIVMVFYLPISLGASLSQRGIAGVEGTLRVRDVLPSVRTRVVKVPPISMPIFFTHSPLPYYWPGPSYSSSWR